MLFPVCIVFVFRMCVYECVYDVVCFHLCEHMGLLICICWCRFGVDDGFGIMVFVGAAVRT